MKYRELVNEFIEREEEAGNIFNREGVTVGLLRKFAIFLEGSAAQQSVQRIGFKRPLVARLGYFFIRKGWWLVGYANR